MQVALAKKFVLDRMCSQSEYCLPLAYLAGQWPIPAVMSSCGVALQQFWGFVGVVTMCAFTSAYGPFLDLLMMDVYSHNGKYGK